MINGYHWMRLVGNGGYFVNQQRCNGIDNTTNLQHQIGFLQQLRIRPASNALRSARAKDLCSPAMWIVAGVAPCAVHHCENVQCIIFLDHLNNKSNKRFQYNQKNTLHFLPGFIEKLHLSSLVSLRNFDWHRTSIDPRLVTDILSEFSEEVWTTFDYLRESSNQRSLVTNWSK